MAALSISSNFETHKVVLLRYRQNRFKQKKWLLGNGRGGTQTRDKNCKPSHGLSFTKFEPQTQFLQLLKFHSDEPPLPIASITQGRPSTRPRWEQTWVVSPLCVWQEWDVGGETALAILVCYMSAFCNTCYLNYSCCYSCLFPIHY